MTTLDSFDQLGLPSEVVDALRARGIEQPTPVQAQVFAPAAEGRDVLAKSRTGSGKTLAFGLPLLGRLDPKLRAPQLLILTPTRELAVQVAGELEAVAKTQKLAVTQVIGGAGMGAQVRALKTAQIVTGTPGRLIDHLDRGTLSLDHARAIVLDEGDEMLDMGFLEDMERILKSFPADGQRLLFSATVPPAMKRVISKYLRDPVLVETEHAKSSHADIEHVFYRVRPSERYHALANLLLQETIDRALIFAQTREDSREVAQRLIQDGFAAAFLNGDMSQDQRTHVMESFKDGRISLLVATDVAARGIDVQGLSHVIHFTMAGSMEAYTHRSGRTGRAGASGTSVSLVAHHEQPKAYRYAKMGHFEPKFLEVPTQGEIRGWRIAGLREQLVAGVAVDAAVEGAPKKPADEEKGATGPSKATMKAAKKLLAEKDPQELVATLMDIVLASKHPGYVINPPAPARERSDARDRSPSDRKYSDRRSSGAERTGRGDKPGFAKRKPAPRKKEAGMETFKITLGENQRLSPGALINMLCKGTGLNGADFGRIDIQPGYTTFDVQSAAAKKLAKASVKFKGKNVAVTPE